MKPHVEQVLPISFSLEHIINAQQPKLLALLSRIAEKLENELQFEGSVDVLNKSDYPLTHLIALGFLKAQNTLYKQHKLPTQPRWGKWVQRELLTAFDEQKTRQLVKATDQNPLCYRFALLLHERYVGDIFIIPVITKRIQGLAIRENQPQTKYETLIVGTDQSSRKKPNYKPDTIFTDGHPNVQETEYFVILTDDPLDEPELNHALSQQIVRTLKNWFADQTKKKRKR